LSWCGGGSIRLATRTFICTFNGGELARPRQELPWVRSL
jgi:hypothetical protein